MWSRFFIIKSYSTVNVLCWAQDRMMVTTDQLVGHFCYSNWASPRCCAEIFERVGGTGIYNQATLHPRRDKHFRATNGAPISIYIYNILEEENPVFASIILFSVACPSLKTLLLNSPPPSIIFITVDLYFRARGLIFARSCAEARSLPSSLGVVEGRRISTESFALKKHLFKRCVSKTSQK